VSLAETGWEEASVICAHYGSREQNQVLDVLRYVQASCSTMEIDLRRQRHMNIWANAFYN
jgi:hypothetical protein